MQTNQSLSEKPRRPACKGSRNQVNGMKACIYHREEQVRERYLKSNIGFFFLALYCKIKFTGWKTQSISNLSSQSMVYRD